MSQKTLALSAIALVSVFTTSAQNMSTPYSVFGIGDLDHRNYGFNSGMGYTGLALKTSLAGAGNNPASVAGLEKSFLLFDMGGAVRNVVYHGSSITSDNSNNHDFTIKQLSASAKINSFWASSVGFRQFSSVSYQFANDKDIEGTDERYSALYGGNGGLHEFYWNNGFAIGKHLLTGITASFISGTIDQTETLTYNSGRTIETTRSDYYGNGRLTYGAIYSGAVSSVWTASLGARFSNATKMNFERMLNVTYSVTTIIKDQYLKYTQFSLPRSYGGGISLASKKGVTVAADYTFDEWSSLHNSGSSYRLVNSSRISTGAEFADLVNDYKKALVRKSFQLGAFFNRSYLEVKGRQINEYGVTAGLTRAYKSGLFIGLSVEGGVRGTTVDGLIRENYGQLNFAISHRDFINSKARKVRYD